MMGSCPKCGSSAFFAGVGCAICGYAGGALTKPEPAEEPSVPCSPFVTPRYRGGENYQGVRPSELIRKRKEAEMKREGSCTIEGCGKPLTTANLGLGYCFRHLRELRPDKVPPSLRPKGSSRPAPPKPETPAKAKKPAAPPENGFCDSCGGSLPEERVLRAMRELVKEGASPHAARRAAEVVLQVVGRG